MSYKVVFSPKAGAQLMALYDYIASASSASIAAQYTEALMCYCEALQIFPQREPCVTMFGLAYALPTIKSAL